MNAKNAELLEKMNRDLNRVLNRMEQDVSLLSSKPEEDQWSANEVLYHLYISEYQSLQYVKKKTRANLNQLNKANWKTNFRKQLLGIYLSSPFKFKAPRMVSVKSDQAHAFEDLKGDYEKLRNDLQVFLKELDSKKEEREIYRHPIAGRMNVNGMLVFMEKHLLRHEKQIERTLQTVLSS